MKLQKTIGYQKVLEWLQSEERQPFAFQEATWAAMLNGESGLVNAPTGCGKTYAVLLGTLIEFINRHPQTYQQQKNNGLQLLWISPLRALAKDIGRAMEETVQALGIPWKVAVRNGDTPTAERQRQKKHIPEILIITPESLHLLLAQKHYAQWFQVLRTVAVDEWHELIGGKRGVQVELALSRIAGLRKSETAQLQIPLSIWGISATIGNLEQAKEVLLSVQGGKGKIIRANMRKRITVESIFPDAVEKYPWAGHLGIKLIDKIIPIIEESRSTLIFINTRGMSERWYQELLNHAPSLAGAVALHHGSIEQSLRSWVEEALHAGKLKAVVCTASLDLGVDFRPVETVIQVGSPKGVARFLQRAGRSGHAPDAVSKIYFLPTHSLELTEAAALKKAMQDEKMESREPPLLCYDVLLQYLSTLAVSEGFVPEKIFQEVRATHCFREMDHEAWSRLLCFLTHGGKALQAYDDYNKVVVEEGVYKITSRRIAMRHRMHIGTIVSDAMLKVKWMSGGFIGMIEEWFISKLEPGDVFTLAGRNLELITIRDMTVIVKLSKASKSIVPSWQGGRMPLSAHLGETLRAQLSVKEGPEMEALQPLLDLQRNLSCVPTEDELLIEQIETKDGFHLFVYPFEGRLVHEAMAAVLAWRISRIRPMTFSFAMNDYGFELLSDQPIPVDDTNVYELFSPENLFADIQQSVNATEMAKRKFRDIAVIGGMIFQGYPGEQKKARHLQSSASLLFQVLNTYEPDHLLLRQAYQEVFDQQMEELRLRNMLERIQKGKIQLRFPEKLTPFSFPIKVDSMREQISSEKLEDRVRKMQLQLEKG